MPARGGLPLSGMRLHEHQVLTLSFLSDETARLRVHLENLSIQVQSESAHDRPACLGIVS